MAQSTKHVAVIKILVYDKIYYVHVERAISNLEPGNFTGYVLNEGEILCFLGYYHTQEDLLKDAEQRIEELTWTFQQSRE